MPEVDLTEQLKSAASQVLSGDQLEAFLSVADAKRLADSDGNIDAEKVGAGLRTLYGVSDQSQQSARHALNWGQGSAAGGPPHVPGDNARAALKRRHGVGAGTPHSPGPNSRVDFGPRGRAAAQRRHETNN